MVGIFPTIKLSREREALESSGHHSPRLERISDQVSQVKLTATETFLRCYHQQLKLRNIFQNRMRLLAAKCGLSSTSKTRQSVVTVTS